GGPEGDALVAVDVRHVHAHAPRLVDLDAREASRELLQRDAALESGERRAQAEVDAVSEREMRLRAARHVEPLRLRELTLVTVGRAGEEQDTRALRHRAAIPRHVGVQARPWACEGAVWRRAASTASGIRAGSCRILSSSSGWRAKRTHAFASSLVTVSFPAEPSSEQKPTTSPSVSRLGVPSSPSTSASS